jgi:hypothetical protein
LRELERHGAAPLLLMIKSDCCQAAGSRRRRRGRAALVADEPLQRPQLQLPGQHHVLQQVVERLGGVARLALARELVRHGGVLRGQGFVAGALVGAVARLHGQGESMLGAQLWGGG